MKLAHLFVSLTCCASLSFCFTTAFSIAPSSAVSRATSTLLLASNSDHQSSANSRRRMLLEITSAAAASFVLLATSSPAQASYSAYSRREEDWQNRKERNEVQFSTARELNSQLKAIAPMNSEGSRIFCPNGPTANVSPLMENKCGDRLALPSVYGRTEDTVGNSIPGFKGGRYAEQMNDRQLSLESLGGFPSYSTR